VIALELTFSEANAIVVALPGTLSANIRVSSVLQVCGAIQSPSALSAALRRTRDLVAVATGADRKEATARGALNAVSRVVLAEHAGVRDEKLDAHAHACERPPARARLVGAGASTPAPPSST